MTAPHVVQTWLPSRSMYVGGNVGSLRAASSSVMSAAFWVAVFLVGLARVVARARQDQIRTERSRCYRTAAQALNPHTPPAGRPRRWSTACPTAGIDR